MKNSRSALIVILAALLMGGLSSAGWTFQEPRRTPTSEEDRKRALERITKELQEKQQAAKPAPTPAGQQPQPAPAQPGPAQPAPAPAPAPEMKAGDPVGDVVVTLEKAGGQVQATAHTDLQGNFTFANLPAGEYVIRMARPTLPGAGSKLFFESGSSTAKLDVKVAAAKKALASSMSATWTPATNSLAKGSGPRGQVSESPMPGGMSITVEAGGSVTGHVAALAVVKSKSNISNN
jgi:hypothetical protein